MNPVLHRFLKRLFIVVISVALLMAVVFGFFLRQYYIPALPFVLLFFFCFTFLTFSYQLSVANKGTGKFTRASMIVTMVRLLVYILLTSLLVLSMKEHVITLVIVIGILYLIFTSFEVTEMSAHVRHTGFAGKNIAGGSDADK